MDPLDQPSGQSPVLAAVQWLEALLLGPLAHAIGTIAVAAFGFLMLAGRVDVRTGARVAIGCFILFGARSIAAGLQAGTTGLGEGEVSYATVPSPAAPVWTGEPVRAPAPQGPSVKDPFAGAAAPMTATTCCE